MTKAVADFEILYDITIDAYRLVEHGQERKEGRILTADEMQYFMQLARGQPVEAKAS